MSSSALYEKSKSLGSGGSMVARLKLKEIDGRAPPGVNKNTNLQVLQVYAPKSRPSQAWCWEKAAASQVIMCATTMIFSCCSDAE